MSEESWLKSWANGGIVPGDAEKALFEAAAKVAEEPKEALLMPPTTAVPVLHFLLEEEKAAHARTKERIEAAERVCEAATPDANGVMDEAALDEALRAWRDIVQRQADDQAEAFFAVAPREARKLK
jgi:hypothetical protein